MKFTSRRKVTHIVYTELISGAEEPPSCLVRLSQIITTFEIAWSDSVSELLRELSRLHNKGTIIWYQMGAWAARCYLVESLQHAAQRITDSRLGNSFPGPRTTPVASAGTLTKISEEIGSQPQEANSISDKVEKLLSFLESRCHPDFSGIIFVRERVTAYLLTMLINEYPRVRGLFRVAACVSNTTHVGHAAPCDSLKFDKSEEVVNVFRSGQKNLIVATNVLEEGIDLPACHLVISFDAPDNFTSYIQRRGRARQNDSEFVILNPGMGLRASSTEWENLEQAMQKMCLDRHRRLIAPETDDYVDDNQALHLRLQTGSVSTLGIGRQHADLGAIPAGLF
jgi:hypothetical protein